MITNAIALGFVGRAANRIGILRELLAMPTGIPRILIKLDAMSQQKDVCINDAESACIRCWWRSLDDICRFSWGVALMLQCDIAPALARIRYA